MEVSTNPTMARAMRVLGRGQGAFGIVSFILVVLAPVVVIGCYLAFVAADQYHSRAAFSVRSEQGGSVAQNFLGVLSSVSGTGSAQDLDLLYDYIRSQAIIEKVGETVDLHAIYARRGGDFYFSLPQDAPIEELVTYWNRMVKVSNESRDGILYVEVRAFDPDDAQKILDAILVASSTLINRLSDDARDDSMRLSSELVDEAKDELQGIRRKLTDFRRENRIVSPELEVQARGGVIGALQSQLAEVLIQRQELLQYAKEGDQRVVTLDNRIAALRAQVENERTELSQSDLSSDVDVYGVFESLLLDQEMLNVAYSQALVNQASAHAEARRQARYVTVHIPPSLAETPLYPQRLVITFVAAVLLFLGWAIMMIFYRNARDRF